jgi:hypothetical protein
LARKNGEVEKVSSSLASCSSSFVWLVPLHKFRYLLREHLVLHLELGFACLCLFRLRKASGTVFSKTCGRMWAPTPATPNTAAGLQTPGGGFNQIGTTASVVASSSNVSHEEHLAAQLAAAASVVDVALSREDRTSVELWDLLV